MNWQQQIEQVQQQAQGFAAQIRTLEEKSAKLSRDRAAFASIENDVEKEMMDLARSVASFQEQTIATIRALADQASKSASEAEAAKAETQRVLAAQPKAAPVPPPPVAPPPPPPPPPAPKIVEPPRPAEPLIFNEKKIPKAPEPVKAPPPVAAKAPAADDDDVFDLEAFK